MRLISLPRGPQRWLLVFGLVIAGMALAATANAANYYACDCASGADAQCQVGNDSANGTSPASAWRTYDRAQNAFGGLAAGDHLSFCRGGVFPIAGDTRWNNSNCTAAQNCFVGAYTPAWASGDEARPRITQTNGHAFEFIDGGEPDHEEGYRFSDLDLRCSACSGEAYGFVLYNDIDDVRLERLRISGFSIGVYLGGSNSCNGNPQCDAHNERLTLVESDILDNPGQGFLGSGNDLLIADNLFSGNGGANNRDHNIYISESGGQTNHIRILRNELYRSSMGNGSTCLGTSLVVHGYTSDLLIEGNLVHEDIGGAGQGCWGISLTAGGTDEAEGFPRAIVRGNTIRNVGNTAIALSSCVDCIIENNIIEHEQPFEVTGISAPALGHDGNDLMMTHLTVRNNSIYTTANQDSLGIKVGGEGTQHVIVSNAIQATNTSGLFACLSLNLPTSAYAAVNNNVCGYVAGGGREWEEGSGSLSAWRTASGFDLASLAVAPGFASPGAPTHDLRAASIGAAMVDAGHLTLSAPREFFGNLRGASPDAGAHEFGSNDVIFANGFESN
ncbi:MAG: right-handed parallel beta-helix repeat-containing protein [Xanthomonadales bacterium]|nr:right-handed parallel beta-helix repeat-containing protein [Xanthomonadales bacterium]